VDVPPSPRLEKTRERERKRKKGKKRPILGLGGDSRGQFTTLVVKGGPFKAGGGKKAEKKVSVDRRENGPRLKGCIHSHVYLGVREEGGKQTLRNHFQERVAQPENGSEGKQSS